jgi:hypothetical protein
MNNLAKKVHKMCETICDLRVDGKSKFDNAEYHILETFKINYNYSVRKSKIIAMISANHYTHDEGRMNAAFRRLVRYGFLRSNMAGGGWNGGGSRERHYEIAFGKEAKAKRKVMGVHGKLKQ